MAKRRAKAQTRKARRKTTKKTARRMSRPSRKASSRNAARPQRRAARKAVRSSRKAAPKSRKAAPVKTAARPKPIALTRERRRLRDDETVAGAPSSLNFASKASAAGSGSKMYQQREREHTEGGAALTGGDVDTDWNDAYSSGEETPGGDMSTPDQDVVEEIGRALGVEYEDAEELKGAEKIESRDRNRWEYDPASAEDYKDRNRRNED